MKKVLAIILILTLFVSVLSGCGDNNATTPNDTQTPTNEDVNETENSSSSDTQIQNSEILEPEQLEELSLTDERAGKAWKYDMGEDVGKFVVSAGYCTDVDYVYDITFSANISKNCSEYESFKSDMQNFESQLKALNDDEISFDFDETEEGLEFFVLFDSLESANRAERIAMAEEIIGITANDSDTSYRFSEIDAELKGLGFVYGV